MSLTPKPFPEANIVFTAPEGMENCESLHVQRMPDGTLRSEWEISKEDLAELVLQRRIVLSVYGGAHPPVAVFVKGTH